MLIKVAIWVDENDETPAGFKSTEEKSWGGASWGWKCVGKVNESDIQSFAYGEGIVLDGTDYPVERV